MSSRGLRMSSRDWTATVQLAGEAGQRLDNKQQVRQHREEKMLHSEQVRLDSEQKSLYGKQKRQNSEQRL
jgi:hypothetical protein